MPIPRFTVRTMMVAIEDALTAIEQQGFAMPRLRIRTMMVTVAVIAVPLGICVERRSRFLARARYHSAQAARPEGMLIITMHTESYHVYDSRGRFVPLVPDDEILRLRTLSEWHWKLAAKYEDAACYPWLPIEADPPPRYPWLPVEYPPEPK